MMCMFDIFLNLISGLWVLDILKKICLFFDWLIYSVAIWFFNAFYEIAKMDITLDGDIPSLTIVINRAKLFIGIFALFILVKTLVTYLAEPERVTEPSRKIAINIFVSIALLVVSPTIFNLMNDFQKSIMDYHTLPRLLLGPNVAEGFDENAGRTFMGNMFTLFFYCDDCGVDVEDAIGLVKNDLGLYEEAIKDFNKVLELDKNYSKAYYNIGLSKYNLKKYDEAIEYFNKALELDSNFAYTYNNIGIVKQDLRLDKEALYYFNKALELDKNYSKAYYNRGISKINLKLYDEAVNDFYKVIELEPKNFNAYLRLAYAKLKLRLYEEAIEYYDKYIDCDNVSNDVYFYRGLAKYKLSDYKKALKDFDKAHNSIKVIVLKMISKIKSILKK